VFLLAWLFLAAAVASLYVGLSEEGRTFLYLSVAASAVTIVLVGVQLRRGSPSRSTRAVAPGPSEERSPGSSSPEP
jgi:hypothetical protein